MEIEGIKKHKFTFGAPDPDRVVVSMVDHKGVVYAATQRGIYRLEGDKLVRLQMVEKPQ